MLNITKEGNQIKVVGADNATYPFNGTLVYPLNSVVLTQDGSGMAVFRSASNFDVLFSGLIKDINIGGEAVDEETISAKFGAVANAEVSGGGGTVSGVSSVNGKTGEVTLTAQELGAATTADLANYVTSSALDEKGYQNASQVEATITGKGYITTENANAAYQAKGDYATTEQLATKQDTLVSGTNIKTINGQTIMGEGNIDIQGGGGEPYTLPIASATTLGGIKVGDNLTIDGEGKLSATASTGAVSSVNGKTGEVTLTAQELGAATTADLANYVTNDALNGKGYITSTAAEAAYQPKGEYLTQASLDGYVTDEALEEKGYQTSTQVEATITGKGYITSTQAGETYQPKGEYATTSQLASKQDTLVSGTNIKTINGQTILGDGNIEIQGGGGTGGAVTSVNGKTGAVTLTAQELGAVTSDDLADYVTNETLNEKGYQNASQVEATITGKGYITTENANAAYQAKGDYVTNEVLNGKGYLTSTAAEAAYQPKGEYLTQDSLNDYVTNSALDGKGYITAETANSTYQPKGEYATTAQLADYVTNSALNGKGYQTSSQVESAITGKGYITSAEAGETYQPKGDYLTQASLSGYATTEQLSAKQDTLVSGTNIKTINGQTILGDGNIEIQGGGGDPYTLPIASATTLGGIKVGDNLTIDGEGKLSSTGGGVGQTYPDSTNGEIFNDYVNNVASGRESHAEGSHTTASSLQSHAEGSYTKAIYLQAHAEGQNTTASGEASHAEGGYTTASGQHSHAEGGNTTASGVWSHAEGYYTVASNKYEHAQGSYNVSNSGSTDADKTIHSIGIGTSNSAKKNAVEVMTNGDVYINGVGDYDGTNYSAAKTLQEVISSSAGGGVGQKYPESTGGEIFNDYTNNKASEMYSHAEGYKTTASGMYSHAEGTFTTASRDSSHAEGQGATASGQASHAEGIYTTAKAYCQHAQGRYNTEVSSEKDYSYAATNRAFIIGNGSSFLEPGDAFYVLFNGETHADGAYSGDGADYAEMFEWKDGNPDNEDRVGKFVTLDGDKIRVANDNDDYILGIVSGAPMVIGDNPMRWNNKYLNDEWGRPIYETIEQDVEEPMIPDDEGYDPDSNEPQMKKVKRQSYVRKLNPDWKGEQEYSLRTARKEWDAVGLIGKLLVKQDGTLEQGGRCDINKDGIATETLNGNGYYVMKVISDYQALIMLK